ncbi:MAG: pentapeptide repeat-containing protein [Desulfomonilaceae bacterium]
MAKLLEGVEAWNKWREANPKIIANLQYFDVHSEDVHKSCLQQQDKKGRLFVNLSRANLQNADFWEANFEGAKLWDTKLNDSVLFKANFQGADLGFANLQNAKLQCANFQGADLMNANFEGANLQFANLEDAKLERVNLEQADVTGVVFSHCSLQRNYRGIRVTTSYGSQMFKSFAQDQDYIEEFRASGGMRGILFWLWWIFADCGRSFVRWGLWSLAFVALFGVIFYWMGDCHFIIDHLQSNRLFSMIYYSVVTFTTLGFGDIKPASTEAATAVMVEVILGYLMLGGLVSIAANKLARRS